MNLGCTQVDQNNKVNVNMMVLIFKKDYSHKMKDEKHSAEDVNLNKCKSCLAKEGQSEEWVVSLNWELHL